METHSGMARTKLCKPDISCTWVTALIPSPPVVDGSLNRISKNRQRYPRPVCPNGHVNQDVPAHPNVLCLGGPLAIRFCGVALMPDGNDLVIASF